MTQTTSKGSDWGLKWCTDQTKQGQTKPISDVALLFHVHHLCLRSQPQRRISSAHHRRQSPHILPPFTLSAPIAIVSILSPIYSQTILTRVTFRLFVLTSHRPPFPASVLSVLLQFSLYRVLIPSLSGC
jgi:hypothetical protein